MAITAGLERDEALRGEASARRGLAGAARSERRQRMILSNVPLSAGLPRRSFGGLQFGRGVAGVDRVAGKQSADWRLLPCDRPRNRKTRHSEGSAYSCAYN